MDRLKGKVALISGGARGQGAAEARLFAGEGANVVIGDVLDDLCKKTADEINSNSSTKAVVAVHLDVTRAADWRAAVDACERQFGGLDVLVNNAGIANVKGIEETSEEEWDSIVNINQKGVWLGMKAAVAGDAPARRRLDHQHLVDLWDYRFARLSRLSRYQGRCPPVEQGCGSPVCARWDPRQFGASRRDIDPDGQRGATLRIAAADQYGTDETRRST